jgi:hypothetical protein
LHRVVVFDLHGKKLIEIEHCWNPLWVGNSKFQCDSETLGSRWQTDSGNSSCCILSIRWNTVFFQRLLEFWAFPFYRYVSPLLNKYFISDIIRGCLVIHQEMVVLLFRSLFLNVFKHWVCGKGTYPQSPIYHRLGH